MVKIGEIEVQITATTSKLRASLAQASSLIRDFSLLSEGLTGGISEAFRQVTDVAIKGLQIGIAALVGSFTLAATTGAEFEDSMMRAFTIMREGGNATADSLSQMTSKALELGRETLFSAIDAAEGMQVLARAGYNTKEVIETIGPVMNLAIADNLQLAESAEYVNAALKSFNFSTSEARRVTDIMALGASKASMDVSELAEAFKYVAPLAAGVGISIEETVAAIGLLSDAGLKGSIAGTSLRRAFSELISPNKKSAEILNELGVVAVTSSGKLRPFADILRDLKTAGMTAAQAMEVFGQRGGIGMVALLSRGSEALSSLTNDLRNSQGAAEDMSQAFRTTVKGRTRDLIASVVDLGLAFSEKFKGPLAEAIFFIRNFVVDIVNMGNRMGIFGAIVKGVKSALEPITNLIKIQAGVFKDWLSKLTPTKISEFFNNLRKSIDAFVTSLQKGELGAILKDTFKIIIALGKILINTIMGIWNWWNSLSQKFRDTARPIIIIVALIIQLFGGVMNLIFLAIILNSMWAALGVKATLFSVILGGVKTLILGLLVIVAIIGAAIVGWTLGSFIGELSIVKGLFTSIFLRVSALGSSLKIAAMAMLALSQPLLLFNKNFRTEMSAAIEDVKIKTAALKEIDWLGLKEEKNDLEKIKDGFMSIGETAKNIKNTVMGIFGEKVKLDVEAPKISKTYMEMGGAGYTVGQGGEVEQVSPLERRKREEVEREAHRAAIIAAGGVGPTEEVQAQEAERGKAALERWRAAQIKNPQENKGINEDAEAIKKMIGQSERIEGVLGKSKGKSLLANLQDRLNDLENIVMDQVGDFDALIRQSTKPEADRKNKARIGAGLE